MLWGCWWIKVAQGKDHRRILVSTALSFRFSKKGDGATSWLPERPKMGSTIGPFTRTVQTVGFGMQLQNATLERTFGVHAPGA
jgi:hypothetical protein